MKLKAKELAEILNGRVDGNPEEVVTSFARIENGKPSQLCFFANPKYEHYVYTSKASILLVNADFEPKQPVAATMIRVPDAYSAVAQLLKYVSDQKKAYKRHRGLLCRIACSAKIGKRVWIGDFTKIGRRCVIGERTIIRENVTIGEGTRIGSGCIIYPGVRIYPGMVIGDNVILHANCVIGSDGFGNAPQPDGTWKKIEHLGNVVIGNNVEIGAGTTVDRAEMESTVICDGVKLDNLCQIAHNVYIGENTVMAAQCGVAGSAKIGKNCMFGGQTGISGHITIADGTRVGGRSGVIGNIRKSGQVLIGFPAIDHNIYMRAYAKFKNSGKE